MDECTDCQQSREAGYGMCGDCWTPQERWQVTTPEEVYWNGED